MLHQETSSIQVLRPTSVLIDLAIVTKNYNTIINHAKGAKVMFILKANAYGHGLVRIAQHLEELNANYFGVAYLEEGIMLRDAGIKTPILVLGGIIGNQIPLFINYDLTITASSIEKLQQIETMAGEMGKRARAHLKIDTGMERIGMHYYSAHKLIEASWKCSHTYIEGIFTHLANADLEDPGYSNLQIRRFREVLKFYQQNKKPTPLIHVSNSGGFLKLPDCHYDMVRIGLLLFGVYPSNHLKPMIHLTPALTWKTNVVYFKVVQPKHPVSYGSTWETDQPTRVVTLPVGYGDGYMRRMSNRAQVLIRGAKYPVIGNICMDQTMVNIGNNTSYNGDEAILIGSQGAESITVEDIAEWSETIPYEVMTNINTRVPRVYVHNKPSGLS